MDFCPPQTRDSFQRLLPRLKRGQENWLISMGSDMHFKVNNYQILKCTYLTKWITSQLFLYKALQGNPRRAEAKLGKQREGKISLGNVLWFKFYKFNNWQLFFLLKPSKLLNVLMKWVINYPCINISDREHVNYYKCSIYQVLNMELHEELPSLYNSRIVFLVSAMSTLFASENIFHAETSKVVHTTGRKYKYIRDCIDESFLIN